jgi:hypothetical protein
MRKASFSEVGCPYFKLLTSKWKKMALEIISCQSHKPKKPTN